MKAGTGQNRKTKGETISTLSWVWWLTPIIPALGRLRQDIEFEARLGQAGIQIEIRSQKVTTERM
jgi:hypothetical protein